MARIRPSPAGPVYTRRQPEKTALYQVMQRHLLTFAEEWTDAASGRTLPAFVTEELHKYLDCGILGRGFAHLYCDGCGEHYVVAFSCKGRAMCPSCLSRRMSAGAAALVDHVLPEVPIRQRRGVITLVTAPGEGEVSVVPDETLACSRRMRLPAKRWCARPLFPTLVRPAKTSPRANRSTFDGPICCTGFSGSR